MAQSVRRHRNFLPGLPFARFLRLTEHAPNRIDHDGLRRVATVTVRLHWLAVAFLAFQSTYRPGYQLEAGLQHLLALLLVIAFNGYSQYRLAARKPMPSGWLLALVSAFVAMVLVTVVSIRDRTISLIVGEGTHVATVEKKGFLARVLVMCRVAASVKLGSTYQGDRWHASAKLLAALQRERIELSGSLHDTAAQSAFMSSRGIDAIRQSAGDASEERNARIDATSPISKTPIWQLRLLIGMGRMFDGRELGRTLDSHVATFASITSGPAERAQLGSEPPLSIETKSLLFTVAQNAQTNAFRHVQASRELVGLDFTEQVLRLSVSDDGKGFLIATRNGAMGSPPCAPILRVEAGA